MFLYKLSVVCKNYDTKFFFAVLNFQIKSSVIFCRLPRQHLHRQMDFNEGIQNMNNIYNCNYFVKKSSNSKELAAVWCFLKLNSMW